MSTSAAPSAVDLQGAPAFSVDRRHWRTISLVLGLVFIVAANFVLRQTLEHTRLPAYPIFPDDKIPWSWRLLLPTDIGAAENGYHAKGTYHWITTGLTVVKIAEQYFSPNAVFYACNALCIIGSFVCTWLMFRSAVFSYSVAICMAFGTQFHWVYVCSPITAFYIYVVFLEANLLCMYKVLRGGERRWQLTFAGTLVLLALNHEQWLSYLAFLMPACAFVWLWAGKAGLPEVRRRVLFVAIFSGMLAAGYLAIRLQYGEQQSRPGDEDAMIFMYSSRVMAVEDFISNVISLLYIAISNYFPPFLVGSNSLYLYGRDGVIAAQDGYHAQQTHLVAMHHLFYWYFFAGITFAVFVYFLARNARTALHKGSTRHLHLTLCMLLIAAGFAIHALIKYRPYLSVPLLTYKCMTSNVGVAYLIGYCLMYGRQSIRRRWLSGALVVVVWATIAYGGLTRPAYLSDLAGQVGLTPVPDPLRKLHGHRETPRNP